MEKKVFSITLDNAKNNDSMQRILMSLDVPTRWNSTYEMLARAMKFREAFVSMKSFDTNYTFLPSEEEWNRAEKVCDLLKPFSVITTYFSGCKYPTSNVYFTQVWRIELLLT